jgi:hypothetical protein
MTLATQKKAEPSIRLKDGLVRLEKSKWCNFASFAFSEMSVKARRDIREKKCSSIMC